MLCPASLPSHSAAAAVASLVVCLGILVVIPWDSSRNELTQWVPLQDIVVESRVVPRTIWPIDLHGQRQLMRQLFAARKPMIVSGVPQPPDHVLEISAPLHNISTQKHNPIFAYYLSEYPLAEYLPKPEQHIIPTMELEEFWKLCSDEESLFLHLSMPIIWDDGVPERLYHLNSIEGFMDSTFLTYLWMGKQQVTAHLHYDMPHNLYLQIDGKKRFILFPPKDLNNLDIFPRLHPRTRQSQVDLLNPSIIEQSKLSQAEMHIAIVSPGDMLYLPPCWSHIVTALQTSRSISLWARSLEQKAFEAALMEPLPLSTTWNTEVLAPILYHLLHNLWRSLIRSDLDFAEFLLETRYQSLKSKEMLHLQCKIPQGADDVLVLMTDYTERIVKLFQDIENRNLRIHFVLDLFEEILSYSFGPLNVSKILDWIKRKC